MANTQVLKRRIRSVGNTRQITKAMELVSAAKMRRVQAAAERSHFYSEAAAQILQRLTASVEASQHPYFSPAKAKARLHIIFTSDSGLAGAYNSNIFSLSHSTFTEDKRAGYKSLVIIFGRKGARHLSRFNDISLLGEYEGVEDNPDVNIFAPILETIARGIREAEFESVDIIYTQFISTLNQKAQALPLIPVQPAETQDVKAAQEVFEFEPNVEAVLESALKLYFESTLRRVKIESAASEHAMRMMSMNNANRNAGDLIDSLTLELNATRQAAITQEMAEIIGGANAIA